MEGNEGQEEEGLEIIFQNLIKDLCQIKEFGGPYFFLRHSVFLPNYICVRQSTIQLCTRSSGPFTANGRNGLLDTLSIIINTTTTTTAPHPITVP
ncbi:hypothetical protein CEXT_364801 [Caerostris extrusa]|uniref:Uncharacterized protein n=1 Tax=Caerostris extrusa TaxID=172846 RepID=A0AAV4XA77_CAEEX|nr:hypothetical protein CEXT_364801 [Caerostris extrusa]